MPAQSVAQRKLFAVALKHPEELSAKNKGLAKLPKETLREFASTKESGLPEKKGRKRKRRRSMGGSLGGT